jgi:hypothetical protein
MNIEPSNLTQTLKNQRISEAIIEKQLDHFLVLEDFLDDALRICHWVSICGEYDHNPILLDVEPSQGKS